MFPPIFPRCPEIFSARHSFTSFVKRPARAPSLAMRAARMMAVLLSRPLGKAFTTWWNSAISWDGGFWWDLFMGFLWEFDGIWEKIRKSHRKAGNQWDFMAPLRNFHEFPTMVSPFNSFGSEMLGSATEKTPTCRSAFRGYTGSEDSSWDFTSYLVRSGDFYATWRVEVRVYHLVMTNSSPWKDPPIFDR